MTLSEAKRLDTILAKIEVLISLTKDESLKISLHKIEIALVEIWNNRTIQ